MSHNKGTNSLWAVRLSWLGHAYSCPLFDL